MAENTKEGETEKKKEEGGESAIKEEEMRKEKKQDTSDLGRKAIKEEEKKQVVETKTEPKVEAGTGAEAEAKADPETETEMGTENNKLEEKEKKKEEDSASKEVNPILYNQAPAYDDQFPTLGGGPGALRAATAKPFGEWTNKPRVQSSTITQVMFACKIFASLMLGNFILIDKNNTP